MPDVVTIDHQLFLYLKKIVPKQERNKKTILVSLLLIFSYSLILLISEISK